MQIKNIDQLLEQLSNDQVQMREDVMPLKKGEALANNAGKMINAVRLQLDYQAMMKTTNKIKFLETDPGNE